MPNYHFIKSVFFKRFFSVLPTITGRGKVPPGSDVCSRTQTVPNGPLIDLMTPRRHLRGQFGLIRIRTTRGYPNNVGLKDFKKKNCGSKALNKFFNFDHLDVCI